ncbi:MAG: HAD family hydrolase [Rhodobacteraceae bacterium]|jgi:phosphoglycolate phosphatase|nr:HAD family hydrolase [Paracoccaceae bacterium]
MPQIRGVLFDKDGTLFDFQGTWGSWAQGLFLDLSGGDAARAATLADVAGYDMESGVFDPASPVIAHTPEEIAEVLLPHLPGASTLALVARMNALAADAPMTEAVPLVPLLSRLRAAGLALGVATNDAEHSARSHLAAVGVEPLFDFVAGSDSGHGAKPAPGPLLAFARAARLDPRQVVMVGDSAHDLHAGRAAGMACVAVLTGLATHDDLAPLADAVLPDIGHLPAWLGLG